MASETFSQLSMAAQKACLEADGAGRMLQLIEHMEPDDRADLLKRVDPDVSDAMALIVGTALVATLLVANLVGALMPMALRCIGLDPALSAGPFIATVIDAAGIAIYFQVALWLMKM